jgi:hypothetical protein
MTQRSSATSNRSEASGQISNLPGAGSDVGGPGDGSLLGRTFASALAVKDFAGVGVILHPSVDFRALTPRQTWDAASDQEVLAVLRQWFGPSRIVDGVVTIDTDAVGDRQRVAYRFNGHSPDGPFVIEQQVYFTHRDGEIDWMRVLCSGFRTPAAGGARVDEDAQEGLRSCPVLLQ